MLAAMSIASSAIRCAGRSVWRASAFAAAIAYAPPDPIATMPSSGSMRSPVPESRYVRLRVHDDEHRLEAAQEAVGSPVLRQLDGRALEIAAILFELGLEAGEQGERVGRRAGKPGQDPVVVEPPDLARVLLDDRIAERDLTVAGHDRLVAMTDGQDRGGVEHSGDSESIRRWGRLSALGLKALGKTSEYSARRF